MMHREARWLRQRLASTSAAELGTVLSVGSGNEHFRSVVQPWIERDVFAPLAGRGVPVLHHELVGGDGIDVDGDLMDAAVRQRLAELGVTTILCLNVLEHLTEPALLAGALADALPPRGMLVLTVPRRFPYHPDPIDTMFRPTPAELTALFPTLDVVDSGSVRCESLLAYWLAKPGKLVAVRKFVSGRGGPTDPAGTQDGDTVAHGGRPTSRRELTRMAFVSTELTFAVLRRP